MYKIVITVSIYMIFERFTVFITTIPVLNKIESVILTFYKIFHLQGNLSFCYDKENI